MPFLNGSTFLLFNEVGILYSTLQRKLKSTAIFPLSHHCCQLIDLNEGTRSKSAAWKYKEQICSMILTRWNNGQNPERWISAGQITYASSLQDWQFLKLGRKNQKFECKVAMGTIQGSNTCGKVLSWWIINGTNNCFSTFCIGQVYLEYSVLFWMPHFRKDIVTN